MAKINTNIFTFTGRLTSDATFKTFGNNGKTLLFDLANNRGYGDHAKTNFFSCKLFGKKAESLNGKLLKGAYIAISGEVEHNRWEDNEGKKHNKMIFSCNDLEFLEPPKEGASGQSSSNNEYNQGTGHSAFDDGPGFEDDIPF